MISSILKKMRFEAIDQFYNEVNELKWYLMHTEDLPAMVADHTGIKIKKLKNFLQELTQSLNTKLEISEVPPPFEFKS